MKSNSFTLPQPLRIGVFKVLPWLLGASTFVLFIISVLSIFFY